MESLSLTDTNRVKQNAIITSPVKVCLHVLRRSRTDVRAMRTGTRLLHEGFSVSIIDVEHELDGPDEEEINGIHMHHIIMPGWYSSRRSGLLFFITALKTFSLSLYWLFRCRADIYHANELTALPASYIVAKLRRKPLVYEAYELHYPLPETSIGFWRRSAKLLVRFLRMTLPGCAGVIATTPYYAKEMEKQFHIPKVTLVRNIPQYKLIEKTDLLRQHLRLDSNTRIALYQGRLQRNRGLEKLVYSAPFLEPGVVIVMMGEGVGNTQANLEALIASIGVADRVKIIPPIPNYDDVLEWTSSADLGLILYTASYSLAVKLILPNKLFEYIMAGVPVLATDLTAIEEVINRYEVGRIVRSINPEELGLAINSMLGDREAMVRMSQNALDAAKRDLNWEKESSQLIQLYQNILQGKIFGPPSNPEAPCL